MDLASRVRRRIWGGVKQRTVVWRLSLLDAGTNAMGLLMSMG